MNKFFPGTTVPASQERLHKAPEVFSSMFLTGGLVLSQVSQITGLEPYMIQNWVKRGFLAPPQNKRYTQRQLCRIIIINMLKSAIPMEQICKLLSYVNGHLDDESDDIIDDSRLYEYFLQVIAGLSTLHMASPEERDNMIANVLRDYTEPFPGARERIRDVLRIMLVAWLSSFLQQEAGAMLAQLPLSNT